MHKHCKSNNGCDIRHKNIIFITEDLTISTVIGLFVCLSGTLLFPVQRDTGHYSEMGGAVAKSHNSGILIVVFYYKDTWLSCQDCDTRYLSVVLLKLRYSLVRQNIYFLSVPTYFIWGNNKHINLLVKRVPIHSKPLTRGKGKNPWGKRRKYLILYTLT